MALNGGTKTAGTFVPAATHTPQSSFSLCANSSIKNSKVAVPVGEIAVVESLLPSHRLGVHEECVPVENAPVDRAPGGRQVPFAQHQNYAAERVSVPGW